MRQEQAPHKDPELQLPEVSVHAWLNSSLGPFVSLQGEERGRRTEAPVLVCSAGQSSRWPWASPSVDTSVKAESKAESCPIRLHQYSLLPGCKGMQDARLISDLIKWLPPYSGDPGRSGAWEREVHKAAFLRDL